MKIVLICSLIALIMVECKTQNHGKGGTQQPKKGAMPCPIKDC